MNLLVLTFTVTFVIAAATARGPPPRHDLAATARYVVHNNNWANLASVSTHQPMTGKPFTNVFSVSDGPVHNSTGVPYFFFTTLDVTVQDLMVNPNATLSMSEVQSGYCASKNWDPQDPRCAKIVLSGKVVTVPEGETDFARESMFSRHPVMREWQFSHKFHFAKMEVEDVLVIDFFGGTKIVSAEDYFKANP